jgi:hypothetical protein
VIGSAVFRNSLSCGAALCCAAALSSAAFGGPLSTNVNAYNDGMTTWHGSTPFSESDLLGRVLSGHVDWAVFLPSDYPYVGAGYIPTPGEVVYTYQIFVDADSDLGVSQLTVGLTNSADNAGHFQITGFVGMPPSPEVIAVDAANYSFHAEVDPGTNSAGLAFSSPYLPTILYGSVQDGGVPIGMDLPSPGSIIPEPATVSLVCLGVLFGAPLAIKRRRLGVKR